ncbi:Protein FAM83A, partial [Nibea albiflora]
IPSSSHRDSLACRPALDLSHNESARLAADSLLSRGLEGYREVLNAEGEVDFLSEPEKVYMLKNGMDGITADPRASDDDDKEVESLSAESQSATRCPASDPTVTSLDLKSPKDLKRTECVLDESDVKVYFQSDSRAAGMKDLVREFIRKATMALAIVMDSFSDVELLCDLLEASRRRNVSIHLLLDHLHLNLFIRMWQDLKLNSKNFPKLSVRSVEGQTYCAKTGRRLTGQIAESFIITDWTEVLTGSYSFSWLSWQVHRSLAVLVKGTAVIPFHQEFHRLNSSSKPVTDFVTYITVPHTLPQYNASQAAQNDHANVSEMKSSQTKRVRHGPCIEGSQSSQTKTKMWVLSNSQNTELECSKARRATTGTQMHKMPLQLYPKPLVQPGARQSASVGAVCTQYGAQTDVESQNQSLSNPFSQSHVSFIQSQLSSLTVTTAAEKDVRVQETNPLHIASPTHRQHRTVDSQSPLQMNSDIKHHNVATEGLFFQQRNRDRLIKPLGIAAGQHTQSRQWYCSQNLKPKVDFESDHSKVFSPSTSRQKEAKTGLPLPLTHPRGHFSGQPQKHHQLHPTTEAPGSRSGPTAMGTHLKPQFQMDSKMFSPGTENKGHLQQPPRLNWMPQNQAARPRHVVRRSSFDTTYRTGQQVGWRPLHSNMNTSLERNKNMADKTVCRLQRSSSYPKHNRHLSPEI